MAYENKAPVLLSKRVYLEKDFIAYDKACDELKAHAKKLGLPVDYLYQTQQGWGKIKRIGSTKLTKEPIYEFVVFAQFHDSTGTVTCPSNEHDKFLEEYSKWKDKKSWREKASGQSFDELIIPIKRYESVIETPDELTEYLNKS